MGGWWGGRGILQDLTASSTSTALSESLFAHIKQVRASLLHWGGGLLRSRQPPPFRAKTAVQDSDILCVGVIGKKKEKKRQMLRQTGKEEPVKANKTGSALQSSVLFRTHVFCYLEFPMKVGHGSSAAARLTHTHTHSGTHARMHVHTRIHIHSFEEMGYGLFLWGASTLPLPVNLFHEIKGAP